MTQSNHDIGPPFDNRWALFLDVDGTLIDFVEHPERAKASPRLLDLLQELFRLTGGALALVSGRTIASVDAIFEPLRLPIAGLHGHERRDALGHAQTAAVDEQPLVHARERFQELIQRHPGTLLEDKGAAVALHYRQAPSAKEDVDELASELAAQLPGRFRVQRGKMVIEILPGLHSKGTAIEAFMSEQPFTGRIPVFIGDDATDELGFRWVNDHDGLTIKVGAGTSSARDRFDGVGAVVRWLEGYISFLRESEGTIGHVS